jgi:hypothetical protein
MLIFSKDGYTVEKIWGGPAGDRIEFSHPDTAIPEEYIDNISAGIRVAQDQELIEELKREVASELQLTNYEEIVAIDFFEVIWEERIKGVVDIECTTTGRVIDQEFDIKL